MIHIMLYNISSPDLQFSLEVLQRKAAISNASKRAAETLKRRRDEQDEDYQNQR